MSGKKGMKHYGQTIIDEVKILIKSGKTQREVAEHFGFENKTVIKGILKRDRKKQRMIENGIVPRKKGRAAKNYLTSDCEKDNEIKKLRWKMTSCGLFCKTLEGSEGNRKIFGNI